MVPLAALLSSVHWHVLYQRTARKSHRLRSLPQYVAHHLTVPHRSLQGTHPVVAVLQPQQDHLDYSAVYLPTSPEYPTVREPGRVFVVAVREGALVICLLLFELFEHFPCGCNVHRSDYTCHTIGILKSVLQQVSEQCIDHTRIRVDQ